MAAPGASLSNLPVPPAHLSVGDANHIWLLGTDNKVYRYAGGGFTQVASIDMATHIAANPDGTVWHAKGDRLCLSLHLGRHRRRHPA